MGRFQKVLRLSLFMAAVAYLSSCGDSAQTNQYLYSDSLYSENPAHNFKVHLTDAPLKDVESVFVNVDHFEILLEKEGRGARLIIGKDMGAIDLLTLRDGVLLPMADVFIPLGVQAKQIRMVLKEDSNFVVKTNGDICQMQTPSAQKSGVKILLKEPILFENGYSYTMVIDFDAEKSVVMKGNGGCLLKPVLKLQSAAKHIDDDGDDDGGLDDNGGNDDGTDDDTGTDDDGTDDDTGSDDDNVTDDDTGTDNDTGTDDGYDPNDPSTWPPEVDPEDLPDYYDIIKI